MTNTPPDGAMEAHLGRAISKTLHEHNGELFDAAKETLVTKVLQAMVQGVLDDAGGPEALAQRAFLALDANHPTLLRSRTLLKEHLVGEIAQRALGDLSDAEAVADQARALIGKGHQAIVKGRNALREHLIEEIAARSMSVLSDANRVASRARELIGKEHEVILKGRDTLKARLLEEVARRSTEELTDIEATARQARQLIDEKDELILRIVDELREQILQSIIAEALRKIRSDVSPSSLVQDALKAVTEEAALAPVPPPQRQDDDAPAPAAEAFALEEDIVEAPVDVPSPQVPPSHKRAANGYDVNEVALPSAIASNVKALAASHANVLDLILSDDTLEMGYYVYGIVAHDVAFAYDLLPPRGLQPMYAPYVLPYYSVAAVISEFSLTELRRESKQDPAWKEKKYRMHEQILEQMLSTGFTVLPMPFGMTYPSETHIEAMLAEHFTSLDAALNRLSTKQEWSVKIYCDLEKLARQVDHNNSEIQEFVHAYEQLMDTWKSEGRDIVVEEELAAMHEGLELSYPDLVETILINCEQRSHRLLHTLAADSVLNPPSGDPVFGASKMVLNAAYLVPKEEIHLFRATLERLAAEHKKLGFSYFIGGPHSPCHFAFRATSHI